MLHMGEHEKRPSGLAIEGMLTRWKSARPSQYELDGHMFSGLNDMKAE